MTPYTKANTSAPFDEAEPTPLWHRLVPRRNRPNRSLSLALQGGGSFGAYTWGVLDRLLQEQSLGLDMISGTSAGAINAVILADGLAEGGPPAARERLARFWRRISDAAALTPFGQGAAGSAAIEALELSTRWMSPYQLNPLGFNPLRDILAGAVDFARLRAASPVRLLIAATRIKDGKLRLFREDEITLEAVLASACLPLIHHAVEIDGEWYWDGGLSANPPLRQLVVDTEANDILLVQVTPQVRQSLPRSSVEIFRRACQITFNSVLQKELDALDDLTALCRKEGAFRSPLCRKLLRLRLHHISPGEPADILEQASALDLDWRFLSRLKENGGEAAGRWLADSSVPTPAAAIGPVRG
ncbi:MAG TPA: patatin-like phospholipase family protein [Stellaceae bacterium]|nr:patatin-like phospholipase family protein [Stellaceae bacterium]